MQKSVWRRAFRDTCTAQKTVRFMWGGEGVLAAAGGAWLTAITPDNASVAELVLRAVLGGLGGLLVAILIIFSWQLFRAPYKQRNEACRVIQDLQKEKSEALGEVDSIINILESEIIDINGIPTSMALLFWKLSPYFLKGDLQFNTISGVISNIIPNIDEVKSSEIERQLMIKIRTLQLVEDFNRQHGYRGYVAVSATDLGKKVIRALESKGWPR